MSINFDIKFKRENKIYYENELLMGSVVFNCQGSDLKHEGIILTTEGVINLQLGSKSSLLSSLKPITLLQNTFELSEAGKLSTGISEYHFEIPLVCCNKELKQLLETYSGIFINIQYTVKCDLKRSFLQKSLQKMQQFCIQTKGTPRNIETKQVNFNINSQNLKLTKDKSMPRFLIIGDIQPEFCITESLNGNIKVEHTEAAIKSIELQLVRVETCGSAEGYSKDATEIQTIQIVDGNICPKLEIPFNMVIPRLFACPTLVTKNFKIEFEVHLHVIFKDEHLVTETFPILIRRWQKV